MKRQIVCNVQLLVLLITLMWPIHAFSDDANVTRRLSDVCSILSGGPILYESVFTEEFLRQVPPPQLTMLTQQLTRETGPCVSMRIVEQRSAYQVSAEAVMKNGYTIPVLLTIETQAPYLIAGLFLRPAVKAVASLESLQTEFSTLGGQVSFMAMNVGGGSIASAINTSERLPVGSTFKLYVLGEIVRAVRQKERKWTDIVRLDSAWRSLPSGRLHTWPHGSPMTLHSLAAMMISESDNTATDALIRLLGPARIASQMSAMGNDRPDINVPFLTTLQAFKLKYADAGLGRQYAVAGHDERVQILGRIDSAITRDSIMPTSTPALADSIEWFATVAELCRAMDWLRREAIMQNDMTALDILGINPGVAVGASWKRVCYKGGSEPGVINMTFMLEHQDGTWYAVCGSWFKSGGGIDDARFAGLMERAIQLLEK
jgi:beta-lactamase class A